ncbi:MAG TPA: cation:proton antiporter [Candidatus Polarisedimenticolia bacterium]|nr:cation:proton antiporter [Candidatus Polarisedimenticolia bacterium]
MSRDASTHRASITKTALVYGAMICAAVLLFLWIRRLGLGLTAPDGVGAAGARRTSHQTDALLHVLLALVVIIVAARLLGTLFRWLGQPPVMGEIVAGILIGPTFLGSLAPSAYAFLLPAAVTPFLQVIAQVGVILYMFIVGLELNPVHLKRAPHTALAISHASIVVPFLLGAALALGLYPILSTRDVPFTAFALFLGVSMSVTAFPVLARILTDRRIHTSALGVMALTCAAVDDVTAWCLLAFVVSVVQAQGQSPTVTVALTGLFIAVMFLVLRPLLVRWARRLESAPERTSIDAMAFVFVLLLSSAVATEGIGIHALFGAFLLGAVIPHESRIARDLAQRLEGLVVVLLLPAFFAFSGMRTQIQLVSGVQNWMLCGLIILVACLGKFGGTAFAARLSGLTWRQSSALGVLMNTRGLVELIVLNVGLDLGVISPTLFAMLVIMALVTTFATSPIIGRIAGDGDVIDLSAGRAR